MENLSGTTIKGYELRERIGAGGFGTIYRAYQSSVGREVAVKMILPHFANQPDFVRRFEAEAGLVARMEHPHIVPLHDYWRDSSGAYLVMRWLRGGSLSEALKAGPYELRAALLLLDQITSALSLAHRHHVVHRDLKPANILLDEDGNAYVADFGIAKDLSKVTMDGTQADLIVESPDYLSPEQARNEAVSPQTDIYSLGVMLYEVLTGQPPFSNTTPVERLYKQLNDPLPPLTMLSSRVADGVNTVIQKATAKNPAHRYPDMLTMLAACQEAAGLQRQRNGDNVVEMLTQREQEVLQRIINGQSNKQIAQELVITLATVKWYVNQIYSKLQVRSRVQAIVRTRELNLITASQTRSLTSAVAVPPDQFAPENPYKGLRAFEAGDSQDFFGREALTNKLVQRLAEPEERSRFLAVIGPSGSGKSSLVKAGLIPALWRGALPSSERWFVAEMLPGSHPLDQLEIALTRIALQQPGNLRKELQRDERGLVRAAQLILPNDGSYVVLVIDQFEEVFTLVEDEKRRVQFLSLIQATVTDPRSRVRIVVTLRADFYDRPLLYPDFGELVRSRMETVLPLTAEGLERAITRPAEQVGVTFESGLIASIVSEVNNQPGGLPLLQYTLTELFDRREGRTLTHAAYQEIGGIVGALARRADEIYTGLDPTYKEATHQMFMRLVTLGEGVEDTRRRVPRSELMAIAADSDMMDDLIDTYAAYRLLSLDHDPLTRSPTVEVAHEAILREWKRLRGWLNDSRHDIRLQRVLATTAAEWFQSERDDSFLLRGSRLEQFQTWIANTKLVLTPKERSYLDASLAEHERQTQAERIRQGRELRLEQRSRNFLRGLVAVLLAATLGAVGLTVLAQQNAMRADRNAAEAQNVALVAGSQAAFANGNTDQAIMLALQAVTLDPNSARAQVALSEAAYMPGTIRTFVGHSGSVHAVALSPDGHTALSASDDKTVILWDIQTGKMLRRFEGHRDQATSVAFMPDGLTAISGSSDKTLIQWDIQTGEIIRRFEGQPDAIRALGISPDGRYIASGGSQGNLILWDTQTGNMIRRFEGHTAGIHSSRFSADNINLVSTSDDKTMILWEVGTGRMLHHFEDFNAAVLNAVFSPDNSMILSGSDDGTMNLWDIKNGQSIRHFYEGDPSINDVAFSPDGRVLLSGGVNGIALWNIETARTIRRLRGHGGIVNAIVFSPDGRTVLSASADYTLRLWDVEQGQLIRRYNSPGFGETAFTATRDGHMAIAAWNLGSLTMVTAWDVATGKEIRRYSTDESIIDIALSPDGQTALFGVNHEYAPSDVVLWDVNTGKEIRRFTGHTSGIPSVAFSPDGRMAASVDGDGVMILWDVATGTEFRRFKGYESTNPGYLYVWSYVGFSPDGQTLVACGFNGMMILWDVATGKEIRHFEGHSPDTRNFVFSSNGQWGFSGSTDGTTILWDVTNGSILHRFSDHSGPIARVAMTADGHFGISGSADDTTLVWDLTTREPIRRYHAAGTGAVFAPDNHTVLVDIAGQIELWRVDGTLDELLTWVHANRYISELTCDQRNLYRLEPLCAVDATPLPTKAG